MTRRSVLLLLLFLSLLGGAVVMAPRIVDPDQYRPFIVRTLEVILGYPVSLAAVEFAPAGGLRLELQSLEIKAVDPADPPLLRVERTYVGLDWTFLLTAEIKVASVTFVKPEFNLVQRHNRPLLRRAKEGAQWSNANMSRILGLGLKDLTLGRVVIQDGVVRIHDHDHPEEHDWVMNQIRVQINNLSPHRASAINGSALVQSIPFTGHGQIGPLPVSLNPLEMPLLLSVEAKSTRPDHLNGLLTKLHLDARAERGIFSTLIHGKLQSGMQTNSLLELYRLELFPAAQKDVAPKEVAPQAKKGPLELLSANEINLPSVAKKGIQELTSAIRKESSLAARKEVSQTSVDLAIRQKSIVQVQEMIPRATLQEFFVYLNDAPLLELKGSARYDGEFDLDLEGTTTKPLALAGVSWSLGSLVADGAVEGNLHVRGIWPSAMTITGKLDLTAADLLWQESLHKSAGVPLSVNLHLVNQNKVMTTPETVLQGEENNLLTVQGQLHPEPGLSLVGTWEMSDILGFFNDLKEWSGEGLLSLDLRLARPAPSGWQVDGFLQGAEGRLGPLAMESFFIPLHMTRDTWQMTDMRLRGAGGNLDGNLVILHWEPHPVFYAQWAVSGVAFERLPVSSLSQQESSLLKSQQEPSLLNRLAEVKSADPVRLEGVLFGQGDFWGSLDKRLLPEGLWSGQADLRLEPGRLAGFDGGVFSRGLVNGQNMLQEGKSLYWKRASASLSFANGRTYFSNVSLETEGLTLTGEGTLDGQGNQNHSVTLAADWLDNGQAITGLITGDSHKWFFRLLDASGG